MSKAFTPNAVAKLEDPGTGGIALILKSDAGESVAINLTLEMQSLVLAALLSKTPGPQHMSQDKFHARTLKAIGVQAIRMASGHPGLQFLVGPAQAIDVAFPQESIPVIQQILEQLASGAPLDRSRSH